MASQLEVTDLGLDRHGRSTNGQRILRFWKLKQYGRQSHVIRATLETDSYKPQHHLTVEQLQPWGGWTRLAFFDADELESYEPRFGATLDRHGEAIDRDFAAALAEVKTLLEEAEG